MGNDYYIPISSLVFPELASAEAISPTKRDIFGLFVGRNSYPTKTTGPIPVNPLEDVLIVYSKPVTWKYTGGSVMDYPLIIKVPESLFDKEALKELSLSSLPQGIAAWAYPKTVFFGRSGIVRYLFRSDEEMYQQIQRLSPYHEVKVYSFIKNLCESFETLKFSPVVLSDDIKEEICESVSRLGLSIPDRNTEIQTECRTGACLGYDIGQFTPSGIRVDSPLKDAESREAVDRAKRILCSEYEKLCGCKKIDYSSYSIVLEKCFLYKGRTTVHDWEGIDSVLRAVVDFTATYPAEKWNWTGNVERLEFTQTLWNKVLKGEFDREEANSEIIDEMRKEVFRICTYFRSPNSFRLVAKDIKSPILQTLFIVLQCEGEAEKLSEMLKEARRRDYCLALYGALKGYAYFSRIFIPKQLKLAPVEELCPNYKNGKAETDLFGEPISDTGKKTTRKRSRTTPKKSRGSKKR